MQVYSTDDDGNIVVMYDSRWKFPELLGYEPGSEEYAALQELWTKVTGKQIEPQTQTRRENNDR